MAANAEVALPELKTQSCSSSHKEIPPYTLVMAQRPGGPRPRDPAITQITHHRVYLQALVILLSLLHLPLPAPSPTVLTPALQGFLITMGC